MALFFFGGAKHVLEQQPLLIALEFLMVQKNMERKPFSYGLQKVSWHIIVLIALFFFWKGQEKLQRHRFFYLLSNLSMAPNKRKDKYFVMFSLTKKKNEGQICYCLLYFVFTGMRNVKGRPI